MKARPHPVAENAISHSPKSGHGSDGPGAAAGSQSGSSLLYICLMALAVFIAMLFVHCRIGGVC